MTLLRPLIIYISIECKIDASTLALNRGGLDEVLGVVSQKQERNWQKFLEATLAVSQRELESV